MSRLKLVGNLAGSGFLKSAAVSRVRLIMSALSTTAVGIAFSVVVSKYMLATSASISLNMLLITIALILLLVSAYLQTVALADSVFGREWTEDVFLGGAPTGAAAGRNAEFVIVLVTLVVANALVLNWSTDGFMDRYQSEGFFLVRMRSADPDERLAALKTLIDPLHPELATRPALRELVVDHLDDPSDSVAQAAIGNIAEMQIADGIPVLLSIVREATSDVRAGAAAAALGRISKESEVREALEELVRGGSQQLKVAGLRGLALMRVPEALPFLSGWIDSQDEQIAIYALWALRRIGDKGVRDAVRERLDDFSGSRQRRCALLDTLKLVGDERDVHWARNQYRHLAKKCEGDCGASARADDLADGSRLGGEDRCEAAVWEDSNERRYTLVFGDSFRVKLLKIVANADGKSHLAWFERIVQDPQESWRTREVANEILRSHRGSTL
jgi:hypothetical protein